MDDEILTEVGKKVVHKRPKKSEQMSIHTEPGENAAILNHALSIFNMPKIDTSDPAQVANRLGEYFTLCAKDDMRPNVPGMALSLGVDRRTLWRWSVGDGQGKNSDIRDIVKNAYAMLNILLEQHMQSGKINPVSGIFLMKNHFGYADKQEVVVTPNNPLGDQKSDAELEQRYLESVADENLTDEN